MKKLTQKQINSIIGIDDGLLTFTRINLFEDSITHTRVNRIRLSADLQEINILDKNVNHVYTIQVSEIAGIIVEKAGVNGVKITIKMIDFDIFIIR